LLELDRLPDVFLTKIWKTPTTLYRGNPKRLNKA